MTGGMAVRGCSAGRHWLITTTSPSVRGGHPVLHTLGATVAEQDAVQAALAGHVRILLDAGEDPDEQITVEVLRADTRSDDISDVPAALASPRRSSWSE